MPPLPRTFPFALFDSAAMVTSAELKEPPRAIGDTAIVTSWKPGHIALTLPHPAPAGSALVVSENYYPGWTATVDGKAAPIGRADLTLIGVPLPTGAKAVQLTFRSETYETGKRLTFAGLFLSLIWLGAGFTLDRRLARSA